MPTKRKKRVTISKEDEKGSEPDPTAAEQRKQGLQRKRRVEGT